MMASSSRKLVTPGTKQAIVVDREYWESQRKDPLMNWVRSEGQEGVKYDS